MSIVESLLKLVDPVTAQQREQERKVAREQPVREHAGDPPTFVCRVCGLRDTQGDYCPTCLAGTMQRERRAPPHATTPASSSS